MTSLKSDTPTFITELFADIDSKNAHSFASRLSEDARVRIGSADPIFGRANVEAALSEFFGMIKALVHETVEYWDAGDTMIIESEVTYTRLDDSQITVPAVSIYRRGEKLIDDYRIFIDLGPVLA
jgi:ketosteroid isomerase-like protein